MSSEEHCSDAIPSFELLNARNGNDNELNAANISDRVSLCYFVYPDPIDQFARIHTSSRISIEKILNRPITKFYNRDDVNVIAAELRLTKTRPISFYKKHNLS